MKEITPKKSIMPPISKQKSCKNCQKKHKKCNRELPCKNCIVSKEKCEYKQVKENKKPDYTFINKMCPFDNKVHAQYSVMSMDNNNNTEIYPNININLEELKYTKYIDFKKESKKDKLLKDTLEKYNNTNDECFTYENLF